MMAAMSSEHGVMAEIAMAVLGISLLLTFARLARGPSLPDRVIALDQIAALVVAMIAAYAISTGHTQILRAALILALISFLGTVAFARYLEKRGRP